MSKINENRKGYKKTSVGWIPEDWEVKKLIDIITENRLGGNYENSESNKGIPVIKMGNIGRGDIKIDKLQYIPLNISFNENDILSEGDLLLNTRNTLDLVGKVAIWRNEIPLAVYNSNLMRMKFNNKFVYSNYYLNYYFNSSYSLKQLKGFAIGTTSVAAIYDRDLMSFKLILPTLDEQRIITIILNTWDKAIRNTQKLIELKEKRKKSLMPKLLSGKKRIKGFNDKWKTTPLEKILVPTLRPVNKPDEHFLALGIRSHGKGTFLKHDFDPQKIDMETLYKVKDGDLIVNITFAWEGAIAIVKKEDEGALVSHRFPTYTFNNKTGIVDFFRYVIIQPRFKYLLELISPGGAGRNRVLSKKDFLKLEVKIPSVDEQISIATIILSADKEIKLLKQKLESLKQQKKGLMQVLLTGKIRVKEK